MSVLSKQSNKKIFFKTRKNFDVCSLLIAGNLQRSSSLPIAPLTASSLLIPFQPSETPGVKRNSLSRFNGYPSNLQNFDDIRQAMEQQRAQLAQNLQKQSYNRKPVLSVLSVSSRNPSAPYAPGVIFPSSGSSSSVIPPASYSRSTSTGLSSSQPSSSSSNDRSTNSASPTSYYPLRS